VSAGTPALTRAARAELQRRHRADAVDMESAAAGVAWTAAGVPWLCLRAISDAADAELPPEVLTLTDEDGRPRALAALRYVLRHPGRLPALVRLGRDTGRAVKAVNARVLQALDGLAG
jgi:hypothetical protein